MKLRGAFLARSAEVNPDGTFEVHGGGVTEFQLTQGYILGRPIHIEFTVVVRLEVDEREVERLIPLQVEVVHNGQLVANATVPMVGRRVSGEHHYYHNALLAMKLDVPRPGDGFVRLTWEGFGGVPPLPFRVGAPRTP